MSRPVGDSWTIAVKNLRPGDLINCDQLGFVDDDGVEHRTGMIPYYVIETIRKPAATGVDREWDVKNGQKTAGWIYVDCAEYDCPGFDRDVVEWRKIIHGDTVVRLVARDAAIPEKAATLIAVEPKKKKKVKPKLGDQLKMFDD